MLKDKISKIFAKNNVSNKNLSNINIMDGFVNIKGYKINKDGSKKLVYHDCGDNVVTDWMRHVILKLLTGCSFSNNGSSKLINDPAGVSSQNSLFLEANHLSDKNNDCYLLNGEQFFWNNNSFTGADQKYVKPNIVSRETQDAPESYSIFPTKVLFGTGCEFSKFAELKPYEASNKSWYDKIVNEFGGASEAEDNFNFDISNKDNVISNTFKLNDTLKKDMVKTRTINSPDSTDNYDQNTSLNKSYGITGPVKTSIYNKNDVLQEQDIKMIKKFGIGRPCFLYFNNILVKDEGGSIKGLAEAWDDPNSDVSLSKDNSSDYLNKITFKIIMPAQTNESATEYYPYNGYSLKQIGLYNDSIITNKVDQNSSGPDNNIEAQKFMPCGTLLAIKNISKIEKTKDLELVMTWTLTI